MDTSEAGFEGYIEEHLVDVHGYRRRDGRKSRNGAHYDIANALDWELLLEFITSTQPDTWRDLEQQHGARTRDEFLNRLTRQIARRGTLYVLRNGIKLYGCYFDLAYFRPASTLNPEHWQKYERNILSVARQLHYSAKNNNSIDLAIFLNGLPILTVELKNKLTGQYALGAIVQYQKDRDIKGEPLLQFKRCLVHLAADGDEVYMTTRLQGQSTHFLPFNKGHNKRAGNPPNPDGYASSYLWEEVFQPDNLLELVGSFIFVEVEENDDGRKTEKLIFPRYHQRDAVRHLIASARALGPGENYLIQHSAGSGKSKTIAWLAHRLASLHGEDNQRVFDSVIVITDRRILDRQLRDAVRQIEKTTGVVAAIEKDSTQLAEALEAGSHIIVTTLQKFPFVLDKVHALAGHSFAIIADEAHSSQTGETTKSMKAVLRGDLVDEDAQESDAPTDEDLINASMKARGRQANLSFFAFTATPKPKTLQTFGEQQADGSFLPSHLYSMRQAIEENFILDVLENYTTFATYFHLLKTVEDDPRYPKSRAMAQMRRYVDLHEHTIAIKAQIMVEHFWENTRHRILNATGVGQAKAMVVTRSRLHAVRYKRAFDKYLKQQGYPLKALVAFSGTVEDGGKEYTEANMNGFADTQTASAFQKHENRFLIVAEKFQTGYDMPLLHTMYIDKTLSGVAAVQTPSRLNRIYPGKDKTLVLDFVNEIECIREDFQDYYETTILSEGTDPNKLYDLLDALADFELYAPEQVAEIAELFLRKGEKAAKLQPLLRAVVDRFSYISTPEHREDFRSKLRNYVRLYAFLSQIITFRDADLERLYLFGRLLLKSLPVKEGRPSLHFAESVDLESYRIRQTHSGAINLDDENGWLDPLSGLDGVLLDDPEKAALSQIIQELNDRFGTEFDEGDRVFFAELKARLSKNESLHESAKVNSRENVRLLHDALFMAVLQTMIDSNFDMFKRINDNEEFGQQVREAIFEQVYQDVLAKLASEPDEVL